MIRKISVLCVALILSFVFYSVSEVAAKGVDPKKQTSRFIQALQKKDFKFLFENDKYYQSNVSGIKSNNPKVLHQKLIKEFYDKEEEIFKTYNGSFSWESFERNIGALATHTNESEQLTKLIRFFPKDVKWQISEVKKEKRENWLTGEQFNSYWVYVSVAYPVSDTAPLVDEGGEKLLKESIFEFGFDINTGLFQQYIRLTKADVYWVGVLEERRRKREEERIAKAKAAMEKRIKEKFIFSDLTVLDNKTKLMWTRDGNIAGSSMNWDGAFKFIEGLNEQKYAGYNDWRLPSVEELNALAKFARGEGITEKINEFFNKIGFKNVRPDEYWSSTAREIGEFNTGKVWWVGMVNGRVSYDDKTDGLYVLPVRAGQREEGISRDSSTTSGAAIGKEGKFFRIKERGMFCENPQVISKKTCEPKIDAGEIVEYLNEDSGFFMKVKKENGQIGWIGRQIAEAQ